MRVKPHETSIKSRLNIYEYMFESVDLKSADSAQKQRGSNLCNISLNTKKKCMLHISGSPFLRVN